MWVLGSADMSFVSTKYCMLFKFRGFPYYTIDRLGPSCKRTKLRQLDSQPILRTIY